MKNFFKKHPELLILLIAVIVIDAVIIWMCLGDQAATAKSENELKNLINKSTKIATSKLRTNDNNAVKAEEDAKKIKAAFEKKLLQKLEQYKYIRHAKETFTKKPRAKSNMIDLLDELITVTLKDKDETQDKFSFNDYYQKAIMEMEMDKIPIIFEIFNGFSRIAHSCAEAEITSVNSVQRPTELDFSVDKKLGVKTYTYIITVTGSGASIKRLLNSISGDKQYFYEISSIKLTAKEQVKVDDKGSLAPVIERSKKKKDTASPREFDIDDLGSGKSVAPQEGEVYITENSVAPFSIAENEVELTVDWIQFVKSKKGGKKKR
jgi:hypothetical protein